MSDQRRIVRAHGRRHLLTAITAIAAGALLVACGGPGSGGGGGAGSGSPSAAADASAPGGHTDYPLTIANCGAELTFDGPPKRIFLANSAPVTYLRALGVLDRTVSKAGAYLPEYYDAATNAELDKIPTLTDRLDPSGHLLISKEAIIDTEPELIFGPPDGISRESLADAGIQAWDEPIYCESGGVIEPGFDAVYDEMRTLGKIFDRNAEAERAIASLRERVAAVQHGSVDVADGRSAAFLYPEPGSVSTWAYGKRSMTHVQLEALGFTNAFADVDKRVFEVGLEELLDRDPDVLILLHSTDDPAAIKKAITGLPGAGQLAAVRNGTILVQLFNFSEPPSPLVLDGLEKIADRFGNP